MQKVIISHTTLEDDHWSSYTKEFDSLEEAAKYLADEIKREEEANRITEEDVVDSFLDLECAISDFEEIWNAYACQIEEDESDEEQTREIDWEWIDDVDCNLINMIDNFGALRESLVWDDDE